MKKFIALILVITVAALTGAFTACSDESGAKTFYDIFCIYDDEAGELSGTVKVTYTNCTDTELSDLKFNLYGNAFRKEATFAPVSAAYKNRAYYAGESYGAMSVENVENCAGWNVAGDDENILIVNLLSPLYPDEKVTLSVNYTLTLAKVNHRTGITPKTVNLGNFYPILCARGAEGFVECNYYYCGDPFLSDCADYSVTIDMPENYTAASSGKIPPKLLPTAEKNAVIP